jgi:hypothetical protein
MGCNNGFSLVYVLSGVQSLLLKDECCRKDLIGEVYVLFICNRGRINFIQLSCFKMYMGPGDRQQ